MEKKAAPGIMLVLLLIGMLTLAFEVQPVKSIPTTWTVDDDGPADFHTIQEAVLAADSGDTIFVYNGTYYAEDSITVDKSLRIVGEDKTITFIESIGTERFSLFKVNASDVEIAGFTMREIGSGVSLWRNTSGCIIHGNIIEILGGGDYFSQGIWLMNSHNNTIADNTITNYASYGILTHFSCNNSIANNAIMNNRGDGIAITQGSNSNIISNNLIRNNGNDGIYITESNGTLTIENKIDRNYFEGIHLIDARENEISNNTIANNKYGIVDQKGSHNTINQNVIANNTGAVLALGGSHDVIIRNLVMNNTRGIYFNYQNDSNIYHNSFVDNELFQARARQPVSRDTWDNGYPSGGNYWSDYSGTDLFSGPYQNETGSDGIGDTPYLIPDNDQDNYPLMEPFGPFKTFSVTQDGETYQINTLSNSTITNFQYNSSLNEISFKATGPADTIGFCNMTAPKGLGEPSEVLVDGVPVNYTQTENATHYILYFTYQHSIHVITIVIKSTPSKLIEKLVEDIKQMNLKQGISNSLDTKLTVALASLEALNANKRNDAINKLEAVINETDAQREKMLTNEQADYIISQTLKIIDLING